MEEIIAWFRRFVETHDRLPRRVESFEGKDIGTWWRVVKRLRWKGQLSEKTTDALCEGLPIVRSLLRSRVRLKRDYHIECLISFVEKHGRIPTVDDFYDGFHVGRWWHSERSRVRLHPETFIEVIESCPLIRDDIEGSLSSEVSQFVDVLVSYIEAHGVLPDRDVEWGGLPLGNWWKTTRTKIINGRASHRLRCELLSIPRVKEDISRTIRGRFPSSPSLREEEIDPYRLLFPELPILFYPL
jgi:hypothetical protein